MKGNENLEKSVSILEDFLILNLEDQFGDNDVNNVNVSIIINENASRYKFG